jgi:hypothetical protein
MRGEGFRVQPFYALPPIVKHRTAPVSEDLISTAPDGNPPRRRGRLLLFITEDHYVVSPRLPLAVAAQAEGYDVTIMARRASHTP